MSKAEELNELLTSSFEQLVECTNLIKEIPLEPKSENIYRLGKALAEISDVMGELYKIYPQLKPEKWGKPNRQITRDYSRSSPEQSWHSCLVVHRALCTRISFLCKVIGENKGWHFCFTVSRCHRFWISHVSSQTGRAETYTS